MNDPRGAATELLIPLTWFYLLKYATTDLSAGARACPSLARSAARVFPALFGITLKSAQLY